MRRPRTPARHGLLLLAAFAAGLPLARGAAGADPSVPPLPLKLDPAVARGLAFLARQQNADGSLGGGDKGSKLAMTGLSLTAFLAAGHTPDVGRHGLTVRAATDWLVAEVPPDGYAGGADGGGMFGQAVVTLALAQAYGVESDLGRRREIRSALERLVKVILDAQAVDKPDAHDGGWGDEPASGESNLASTVWTVLALRAAQDVGVEVPKAAMSNAADFVARCYGEDRKGFAYQPGHEPSPGMTGAGVLSLYLLDAADRPEVGPAIRSLADRPVDEEAQYPGFDFYHATHAAFHVGDPAWAPVSKAVFGRLLGIQDKDGGWHPRRRERARGRVYATSMAVLALTVPYGTLPLYQR